MPSLSEIQIYDRLYERLKQLKAGEIFETRTLAKLLNEKQLVDLKTEIKQGKVAKKPVHAIQTDFIEKIVIAMTNDLENIATRMVYASELRGARIYMDAYCQAFDQGKNPTAEANAALTRAGFPRQDRQNFRNPISKRDQEIQKMEDDLRKMLESRLSDAEREQLLLDRQDEDAIELKKPSNRKK
jgi:hypothetical protein